MATPQQRTDFGREMKKARTAKKWTLKVLAEQMRLKDEDITEAALSNWETGKNAPREIQTVYVLETLLDIHPRLSSILGYKGSAPGGGFEEDDLRRVLRTLEARPVTRDEYAETVPLLDFPDSLLPAHALAREVTVLRAAIAILASRLIGNEALDDPILSEVITEAHRPSAFDAEAEQFALAAEGGVVDPGGIL